MRPLRLFPAALVLWAGHAAGQTSTNTLAATSAPADADTTPPAIEDETTKWSFSASVYTYLVPDSRDYAQPTITADHAWLHLEARYNYEGLDTGSAWIGYNFSAGDKLAFEFTPMLGGVFGDTTGVAPGYEASLGWWKLELYTEGEYVFDTGNSSDNFFYTWSELSLSPVEWLRFGGAVQRTKVYQTGFDLQRGFLLGFSFRKIDLTGYVFNPFDSRPMFVVAVGLQF